MFLRLCNRATKHNKHARQACNIRIIKTGGLSADWLTVTTVRYVTKRYVNMIDSLL